LSTATTANDIILGWINALAYQHVSQVKIIAANAVRDLKKHILTNPAHWSESELEQAFCAAVLLRAMYDYAHLVEETSDPAWISNHEKASAIWYRLCDCRERFAFTEGFCQGPIIDQVSSFLVEMEQTFLANFGPGSFFSPELVLDEINCSICNRDFRGCEHLSGKIYGGKLCKGVAQKFRLRKSGNVGSIVSTPRDPRCRIWPWQAHENQWEILYLSTFKIDDFMEQDDWHY
jgi:hypothetical protein